ncbi:uncharacterized protein AC631_02739 [Debaryomyces fabryi]|uniref:Uncharacterized protein n=1 Tax=Debaryomyces fabryi TaxID=58627 RepID=A0A0V1PZ25_9ASCO|nr:uncharacterized protein AC631_02739 [Debaryomyces fabryi]KSA01518.1 hypothetical protein AC631_02739 [Debaryomyces fabryi]CUM52270.1 unnamed protein product [Debaryomyces fabryi]
MGIKDKLKRTSRIFINDSHAKDDSKNVTGHEAPAEESEAKKTEEPLETGATEQEGVAGQGNEPAAHEAIDQTDASEGQFVDQEVSAAPQTEGVNASESAPVTETVGQSEAVPEPLAAEPEAVPETNPEPLVAEPEALPQSNPQTEAAPQLEEPVTQDAEAVPATENTQGETPLGLKEAVDQDAAPAGAEGAKDTTKPDLASQGETAKEDVQKASKNVNNEVKKDAFFKRFLGKFKKSSSAK